MGKIRTRIIGDESVEDKQKKEQKERSARKKSEKMAEAMEKHMDAKEEVSEKTEVAVEKPAHAPEKASAPKKIHIRGKKYTQARKKFDDTKVYSLSEAIAILKKNTYVKFVESVEIHANLIELGIKGEVELPHSTGKQIRVEIVSDELISKLEKGIIEFDMLVAHPSFMPKIAKFARVLGPKGLMPNPKSGTVSMTPEEVAKKFRKGALRWKSEPKFPLLHQLVAKLDAEDTAIEENAVALLKSVGRKNIKDAWIKSTMSPSLKLDLTFLE